MSTIPPSNAASVVGASLASQRSGEVRAARDAQRTSDADHTTFKAAQEALQGANESDTAFEDAEGRGGQGRADGDAKRDGHDQPADPSLTEESEAGGGLDVSA